MALFVLRFRGFWFLFARFVGLALQARHRVATDRKIAEQWVFGHDLFATE
jgi:hypothetical protein